MRKLIIFLLILSISFLGFTRIFSQDNETTTTYLTQSITSTTESTEGTIYSYYDYQELISQIYKDVYQDIYDELYNEIIESIDSEFYEQIYASYQNKVDGLLAQEEFSLYVDDLQKKVFDVVELANNSVLGVVNYSGTQVQAVGSGVVYKYDEITETYYLITNEHVITKGNSFSVAFEDETEYAANLIGYDVEVDIAILTFKAADKPNIIVSNLGSSSNLTRGEIVIAAGNPQGFAFYGSVTLGIVSGLERKVDFNQYIDYIQHDSAINPGNSGGPIYNLEGEVIGINVSKYADTNIEKMGFAIPIDLVKRIITRIEAGDLEANTIMPRLGANYYDIVKYYDNGIVRVSNIVVNGTLRTDRITITLPNQVNSGFLVYEVTLNSTLSLTEIKSGDLIVAIDDFLITNQAGYYDYMYNNHEAGDLVTISYYAFNDNGFFYDQDLLTVEVELK